MKKTDVLFIIVSLIAVTILTIPLTSQAFFSFTNRYLILGGFIKFFIFASYGDILSQRLIKKNYKVKGLFYKAIIWGLIGIIIVFIFRIFTEGIIYLQSVELLPFENNIFFTALFISLFMNLIFAPTMMLFHRVSDHYIEHKINIKNHRLSDTIKTLDYQGFMTFVIFKTIPLFWIPAHTITFLLPITYRVFFASLLGIALGFILGIAKMRNIKG